SACGDEATTIANAPVTRRAVDIETLASARQNFGGYRERHKVAGSVADFSRVQVGVFVEIAARHRALDRQAGRATVRKEIALRHGPVIRLQVHIEAASGGD